MIDRTLARLEFDKVRLRLAEHTAFSAGRRLALDLTPSFDADEVKRRQGMTSQARAYGDRHGAPPLGGAHDMRDEIESAARGRTLLPQELLDIRDTVHAVRRMRRALTTGEARKTWPDLALEADRLDACPALADAIAATLDDDGNVLDGASDRLRRIRSELRVAHDRLMRQLERMVSSSDLRDVLQEALITQREGRYVLPVKSEKRSKLPGVVHDTSDSGATVFVEPLKAVEPGNRCRELERDEEKEVARILRDLSAHVGEEAAALTEDVEVLGVLDLAFASADFGYSLKAIAPTIVDSEQPMLSFPGARHPLLDPEQVVAVDVRVGGDFRQLVITGPNTGGKTVTLKTTGLLVVMAQSGLHVPANDGARMAVFDGVYVDIGDEQSIEQSLSTFSSHMTNIIGVLETASPSSLVLLDELGAGTDPVEGAALAEALLAHLYELGAATIASTHYSSLKVYAHKNEGVANASVEFDVDTLKPTYELTIGLPGRSNALAIALRLGLPDSVVEEARGRMAQSDVQMEDLLAEIRDTRLEAAEDRAAAAETRAKADAWAEQLEGAVHDIKEERSDILDDARKQAEEELAAVQDVIQRLQKEAEREEATAALVAEASRKLESVAEVLADTHEPAPVRPAPTDLEVGAKVRLLSANQQGEVLRLKKGKAEVLVGRLRITVPTNDLELVAPRAAQVESDESPPPKLHRGQGAADGVIELDLRGLRVDEGLLQLDAHLDQALLSGLPWVRIIHGHGTGAMKSAVREELRRNRDVKSFRRGEQGEGGDGATVVYFD